MEFNIPYTRLIKLSIITSVIFGLVGAAPFMFGEMESRRTAIILCGSFILSLILWALNLTLLRLFGKANNSRVNTFRFLLSVIICLGMVYAFHSIMQNQLGSARSFSKMPQGSKIMRPLLQFESLNLVILIFLDLIILKGKKSHIETENITLRVSNLEAKNQLLLQQLDPHFLFNSLSTLRSLIKRNAVSAEEYLEKLAGILRYSFQNSVKSLIPLTDEIELCRQYLGMQKVRFGNALLFDINVPEGLLTNGEVPVYCVQLLIENAIKHNAFTESMPLFIDITGDVNTATLTIINNLQQKNTLEQSSRIGLANLSARYTALGAPDIEIRQTSETYSVKISVFNYESSNNRR